MATSAPSVLNGKHEHMSDSKGDSKDSKDQKEKFKALQLTIDKLEKTYGKGAVMKLSDEKVMDVPAISTGSLGLDVALGIGGIPRGRVTEIYGPESSGKTTLTMHCIAEAQRGVALRPSSMRNTPLTRAMLRSWASIPRTC
jgi:predicted ATP-dependent serine protease